MGIINVLIAEDHELYRDGLKRALENTADFRVIGHAASGKEIIDLTARCSPDLIIMDIRMKEVDGIEATRQLRKAGFDVPILMLTGDEDPTLFAGAMAAGADGYMLKTTGTAEIVQVAKQVARGEKHTGREFRKITITLPGWLIDQYDLTRRDCQILDLLRQGFEYKEIAGKLNLAPHTVANRISLLSKKFDAEASKHLLQKIDEALAKGS